MKKIIFVLVAAFLAAFVFGNIINVYPGDSIQAAVNVASDGDTVYVHNGTYTETIEIVNIELTLQGESKNGCIIQATTSTTPSTENTIYADSWDNIIVIKDLTIKSGHGGISANNGSICNLKIDNVKFTQNDYGLLINRVNLEILNCEIDDNNYTGLYIMDSNVNIIDCIISNNNFDSTYQYNTMGGGVYVVSSNDIYISGTEIIDNYAYDSGGGLAMITTTNSITFDVDSPCTIENNTVQTGVGDDLYAYEHEGTVNVYTSSIPNVFPEDYWIINPVSVGNNEIDTISRCFNFPNPVKNSTNIMFNNHQNKMIEIVIYTVKGQRIEKVKTKNSSYVLDVFNYTSGVYFYSILSKNVMPQYGKMIVVK